MINFVRCTITMIHMIADCHLPMYFEGYSHTMNTIRFSIILFIRMRPMMIIYFYQQCTLNIKPVQMVSKIPIDNEEFFCDSESIGLGRGKSNGMTRNGIRWMSLQFTALNNLLLIIMDWHHLVASG